MAEGGEALSCAKEQLVLHLVSFISDSYDAKAQFKVHYTKGILLGEDLHCFL